MKQRFPHLKRAAKVFVIGFLIIGALIASYHVFGPIGIFGCAVILILFFVFIGLAMN